MIYKSPLTADFRVYITDSGLLLFQSVMILTQKKHLKIYYDLKSAPQVGIDSYRAALRKSILTFPPEAGREIFQYSCRQNCLRALPVALLQRLITILNAFLGLTIAVFRVLAAFVTHPIYNFTTAFTLGASTYITHNYPPF